MFCGTARAVEYPVVPAPPPGANPPACTPSALHPNPVILLHGTTEDMFQTFLTMSPALAQQGYCVYALNFGNRGTQTLEESIAQISDFVDQVRRATGAQKVSFVGHSQGGMLARYYVFLHGGGHVEDVIGLSPDNHGTTNPLVLFGGEYLNCPGCLEQVAGSPFMAQLNAGDETPTAVDYTVVETSNDELVTPYQSAFLDPASDPPSRLTNILLQDECPNDAVEHMGMPFDPAVQAIVANALARSGPADPAFRPPVCA